MKKLIFLLFVGILFSCNNQSNTKNKPATDDTKFERQNFAVVWHWTTNDDQLVSENIEKITEEFMELWQDDEIENAYFNTVATDEMVGDFVNISFFIKAKSEKKARKTLDKLTVVKKGIANYTLIPVGTMWLDRKHEVIREMNAYETFVAVWTTNQELKAANDIIKAQSDAIMNLWNAGVIENVYFDMQGTNESNKLTDFVFFINAESQTEAFNICGNLPLAQGNFATFKLIPVGVFWLGTYSE